MGNLWKKHIWIGAAILTIAALVRLSTVGTARFTADEAHLYSAVRDLVEGRTFAWLGPEMTRGGGHLPGAAFFYLMAMTQVFFLNPIAANVLVAVLNVVAVLLFWNTWRKPFGEPGAAMAAILLAVMPWSSLFGDRISAANVFSFWLALGYACAARVRERPDSRAWMLLVFSCLIMPQFHAGAPIAWLALAALAGVASSDRREKIDPRWPLLGCVLGALAYLPYLIWEAQHGFANTQAIMTGTSGPAIPAWRVTAHFLANSLRFLTLDTSYLELAGYWSEPTRSEQLRALFLGSMPRPFNGVRLLSLFCSIGLAGTALGVVLNGRLRRRHPEWRPYLKALAIALAASWVVVVFRARPLAPEDLQPLLPLLFTVFAALGARLSERPHPIRDMALMLVVSLGAVDSHWSISRNLDGRNGVTTQLTVLETMIDTLKRRDEAVARLDADFPYFPESYDALIRHAYRGRIMLVRDGFSAPRFLLHDARQPLNTRLGPPFGQWYIGPVTLFRIQ